MNVDISSDFTSCISVRSKRNKRNRQKKALQQQQQQQQAEPLTSSYVSAAIQSLPAQSLQSSFGAQLGAQLGAPVHTDHGESVVVELSAAVRFDIVATNSSHTGHAHGTICVRVRV